MAARACRPGRVNLLKRAPTRRLARAPPAVTRASTQQTYSSFEDMLARSPEPLLVDFFASWCVIFYSFFTQYNI